jgi:hypothetical protein
VCSRSGSSSSDTDSDGSDMDLEVVSLRTLFPYMVYISSVLDIDLIRLKFFVLDPDSESASGSQKAKIAHETEFIFEISSFEELYVIL